MKTIYESMEDRVNYLRGLIRIAKCNGVVEPEEREFFSLAAKGLELESDTVEKIEQLWSSEEAIPVSFSTRYHAVFFVQEALQLCIIDGSFDEEEKHEMELICDELRIQRQDFHKILSWIMEGMAWKKRGEELMSEIAKGE